MRKLGILGSALLLALGLATVGTPSVLASTAVTCPPGSNLQNAINAAPSGATLNITGTCTGNFTISGKNLTFVGGTLDGNNSGTVLTVNSGATAVLKDVTVQHGNNPKRRWRRRHQQPRRHGHARQLHRVAQHGQ